ncbi:MAG: hemolysin III family protein [Bullifex sp.]|nr:hemolysin III family protein [Bullifex sp.]
MNWLEKHITLQNYDDPRAERENAYTHFFGSFLSIIGLVLVVMKFTPSTPAALKAGFIIFALSNLLLYTASGLYHFLPRGNAKRVCRILDHSNIYFLIAGTYTPLLLYVGSPKCLALTAFMWAVAALGICFTLVFWGRLKPLHPILYLLMGWCIVLFWNDVTPFVPKALIGYLIGGGVTYSIGVIFYAIKKIPHYHAIWHLFVLAGSIWFYIGLYGTLL